MTEPRVALFLPGLYGGGAERVMLQIAGGLLERDAAVDLLLVEAAGELLDQVPPGVRLIDLQAGRVLRAVRPLAAYLEATRPRTLLAALPHANIAAVRANLRVGRPSRLVLSEHAEPLSWLRHAPLRERLIFPPLMRLTYPRADAIVTVSQATANGLVRLTGVPRERIAVINNPAVPADLDELARQPVDHPWFASGGPPVVLAIGRLNDQKDYPSLLRAFARLRAGRDARLIILGDGPHRERLHALAAELGIAEDVDLPGFQPNPFAWLARAQLLALASRSEGFGLVLVEAMACGTPVVSSDCPGGPAEILDGGRYGRLVPVGDADAMARAMAETLDAPPSADLLRARAADFTVAASLERYMKVLLP